MGGGGKVDMLISDAQVLSALGLALMMVRTARGGGGGGGGGGVQMIELNLLCF